MLKVILLFQKLTIIAKDLPYTNQPPGAPTSNSGTTNEVGLQMGTGVRVAGVQRSLKTGDYKQTDDPLDLAIDGKGYYQIQLPNGDIGYTRVASFRVDSKSNNLSTIEGYSLYPNITVPPNAQELMVANDGTVEVSIQGNTNSYTTLGQISLATSIGNLWDFQLQIKVMLVQGHLVPVQCIMSFGNMTQQPIRGLKRQVYLLC